MELSVRAQLLAAQQEGKVVDDRQAVGAQRHLRALQLPPHLREQRTGENAKGAETTRGETGTVPLANRPRRLLSKEAETFGRCSSRILLLTMLWPIIPRKTAVCGRTERIRLERDSTRGCWFTSWK